MFSHIIRMCDSYTMQKKLVSCIYAKNHRIPYIACVTYIFLYTHCTVGGHITYINTVSYISFSVSLEMDKTSIISVPQKDVYFAHTIPRKCCMELKANALVLWICTTASKYGSCRLRTNDIYMLYIERSYHICSTKVSVPSSELATPPPRNQRGGGNTRL